MKWSDATVGVRVRTKVGWSGVPRGTEGVIDQVSRRTVMVAWNLPDRPLPDDWRFDEDDPSTWAAAPGTPLRDGFSGRELEHLEVVPR